MSNTDKMRDLLNRMDGRQHLNEGYRIMPNIDRDRYGDREHEGLEGPINANGRALYYDKHEGRYYDPDTDMFLSHDEAEDALRESGCQLDEISADLAKRVMDKRNAQYGAASDELRAERQKNYWGPNGDAQRAINQAASEKTQKARDKFVNAGRKYFKKKDAEFAKNNPPPPVEKLPPEEVAQLKAQLKNLERDFDPNYAYSDDHSVFSRHEPTAREMSRIRRRLAQHGEQLDELSKDTLKSYGKKAAGEIRGKTMQHSRALDTYSKTNSEKKAAALRQGVDSAARKLKNRETGVQRAFDRLEEGTWSLPDTPDKQAKLLKILSKPLNAESASHVLYRYLGNDDLFDRLADEAEYYGRENIPAERQDVRDVVVMWLQKNADQFPEYQEVLDQLDSNLLTELSQDTLKSYVKKANLDAMKHSAKSGTAAGQGKWDKDSHEKAFKRAQGVDRAVDRLSEAHDQITRELKQKLNESKK